MHEMQPLEHFRVHVLVPLHAFGLDIALTNTAACMLLVCVLSTGLLWLALGAGNVRPGRLQLLGEMYLSFIREFTVANIHEHGERYVPVMLALFTLIVGSNLVGLLPGAFTPTTQIVVTGTLAVVVFTYTIWLRIRLHGWRFALAFVPRGVPPVLLPLMVPIELLSFLARPVSLAVRLFANMTAGHTVLGVIAFFGLLTPWYAQWVPMSMSVALLAVEFFIAGIQAYIFCVLCCVYIDDAIHAHA